MVNIIRLGSRYRVMDRIFVSLNEDWKMDSSLGVRIRRYISRRVSLLGLMVASLMACAAPPDRWVAKQCIDGNLFLDGGVSGVASGNISGKGAIDAVAVKGDMPDEAVIALANRECPDFQGAP